GQIAVAVEQENRTSRGVVGGRAGSHRINQKAEEGLAVRCGKVDAHRTLALHRRDYRWQKYEPFLECRKRRDRHDEESGEKKRDAAEPTKRPLRIREPLGRSDRGRHSLATRRA